nr:hypothetical protein [Tanacetum cinerariifolium]
MSDSEHSSVTYTSVPSPVEDYSDIGSPEVDGPPSPDYMPGPEELEQAPLSSDYVPGPEEPEQAPPSPVYLPYVPELVYPEYMPPEDDVFPVEEQSLPIAARCHLYHYLYHHHHLIALLISRFSKFVYRFGRGCVLLLLPLVRRSGRVQ